MHVLGKKLMKHQAVLIRAETPDSDIEPPIGDKLEKNYDTTFTIYLTREPC